MTNPAAAMRMLITYAICIPLAIFVGYLLTNPLDYGTLGFLGLVIALLVSPIFIKWHYPFMVFGLSLPAHMFFLKGNPPFWQVVVIISLGIAIVERAISTEKRFLKAPAMAWALLFTAGMTILTMQLTGGFQLHSMGGESGGGRKYIGLLLGIAIFFALISRGIPPAKRRLYIGLFFLSGALAVIRDLTPFLTGPLRYISLVFPPDAGLMAGEGMTVRLGQVTHATTAAMLFMVARYSLRGILDPTRPLRLMVFASLFLLSLLGGFRGFLVGNMILLGMVFLLEGLHRTRWLVVVMAVGIIVAAVLPFAGHMPLSIQRSLSFLPVGIDPIVKMEAEHSTDWRIRIWQSMLPKIPQYLLLGKGYSISKLDYMSMGEDNPFARTAQIEASEESLAISNDFHSGPLSTIICFGIWGCLSILALMVAGLHILWRNYKYGDPALKPVNTLLLAMHLEHIVHFFLIFGAFDGDVAYFARVVGFSVALNWGVCRKKAKAVTNPLIKPLATPAATPQTA
jgi:hypothetical protein